MRNIDADRLRIVNKTPSDLEIGYLRVVQSGLLVNLPGKQCWKRVVLFLYMSKHRKRNIINRSRTTKGYLGLPPPAKVYSNGGGRFETKRISFLGQRRW